MQIGQNTPSGALLQGFVERLERLNAEGKEISASKTLVMAEVKAAGFTPKAVAVVVRRRAMKPQDLAEAESLLDIYEHALGMRPELPLFKQMGLIDVDIASRESVIEAMKRFVPKGGAIVIEAGGRPIRLTRGEDGEVTAKEVVEKAAKPKPGAARAAKPDRAPPPDVDDEGAEALGGEAFRENAPIIANPFPYGDARRPLWDKGWRDASGNDGMGPDDGR